MSIETNYLHIPLKTLEFSSAVCNQFVCDGDNQC